RRARPRSWASCTQRHRRRAAAAWCRGRARGDLRGRRRTGVAPNREALAVRPYRQLGDIPRKRHMRFSDDGHLAYEELFGREGFSGPSSLLYHRNMPEGAQDVSEGPADLMTPAHEQVHTNAHLKGFDLPPQGDVITGRRWLLVNDDVHIGLVAPVSPQQVLYVNGSADEVLFVHAGSGALHSQFGHLIFKRHDYIVIPRGTIYRIDFDDLADVRLLCMEVTGLVDVPDRY